MEKVPQGEPIEGVPPKQEIKAIPGNKVLIQWMPKHD